MNSNVLQFFKFGFRQIVRYSPYLTAAILLFAGISKLSALESEAPLLLFNSQILNTVLLAVLSAIEIAIGLNLIFAVDKWPSILTSVVLFMGFSIFLVYFFLHGKVCPCHAGEQFIHQRNARFLFSIVRNISLLCLLIIHQRSRFIHLSVQGIRFLTRKTSNDGGHEDPAN
jgi:hypothetical protein